MTLTDPVAGLGRIVLTALRGTGRIAIFAARGLFAIPDLREFLRQMVQIGWLSLPVVGLTALFTGAALALSSTRRALPAFDTTMPSALAASSTAHWWNISSPM